jgi:hypothetical protein
VHPPPTDPNGEGLGQRQVPYKINRCLLCHHTPIDATTDGRIVTTSCPACLAVLKIEFDPPDQPELRARIEHIDEPDMADRARVGARGVYAEARSFRVRSR